jgi:hypothetical protein
MLTTLTSKLVSAGLLLVLLIAAGIFLHKSGKPYQPLVFGVHKIFTIAMIVILTFAFIQVFKGTYSGSSRWVVPGSMILALAGLLFSGAMMSLDRYPLIMLVVHRVFTVLFLAGFSYLGYLVFTIAKQPG